MECDNKIGIDIEVKAETVDEKNLAPTSLEQVKENPKVEDKKDTKKKVLKEPKKESSEEKK